MSQLPAISRELENEFTLRENTLISKQTEFLTEIGDEKEPGDFFPQVKVKRWDNEGNFSLRLQDVGNHRSGTTVVDRNKVIWTGGGLAMNFQLLKDFEGTPGMEWSVIIPSRPAQNRIRFSIETKGLVFFYQPHEITDGHSPELCFRPDNVKGSYAVYNADQRRGNKYTTGKAFHIYRPKAVDAKGDEIWAEIDIRKTEWD